MKINQQVIWNLFYSAFYTFFSFFHCFSFFPFCFEKESALLFSLWRLEPGIAKSGDSRTTSCNNTFVLNLRLKVTDLAQKYQEEQEYLAIIMVKAGVVS